MSSETQVSRQETEGPSTTGDGAAFTAAEWNSVVDAVWWEKETDALRERLGREFPDYGPGMVEVAIGAATARIAHPARVANFLPVLVAREARDWLRVNGQDPTALQTARVVWRRQADSE